MVAGTALLSRWGQRLDRGRLIHSGLFLVGIALSFLSVVGAIWDWWLGWNVRTAGFATSELYGLIAIVMATAMLAGLAFVAIVVPSQTIIQERAPEEIRGRVFAVQLVLSNVATVGPLLFLGELADLVGVDWTLMVLGLLVLAVGLESARRAGRLEMGPDELSAESSPAA
jgi:MFS family permease